MQLNCPMVQTNGAVAPAHRVKFRPEGGLLIFEESSYVGSSEWSLQWPIHVRHIKFSR